MRRPLPRPLRAALLALSLLLLANALVWPWAGTWDPDPLPYRNPRPARWIERDPQGFWLTWLGQPVLPRPKEDRFRLLMVGSSALQGAGVTPFQSLPGRLQHLLDQQRRPVEVINAGVAGSDSGVQGRILQEGLEWLRPDLVVFYGGNNESHRLRIYKELNPHWSPGRERWRSLLERAPLYRLLLHAFQGRPRPGRLDGVPIEEVRARITARDRPLVEQFYQDNLEQMARACRRSGVPLVLCAVAVNQTHPPEYGFPTLDPALEAALERARRHGDLEGFLAQELQRQPEQAWLHYLQGRRRLAAGRVAEAVAELDLALATDPEPSRATPGQARRVREVAAATGTLFVDLPARLRREYGPLLGDDLFLDFCHFLPRGNHSAARSLLAGLEERGLLPPPRPARRPETRDPLDLSGFDRYQARLHGRTPPPGSDAELRRSLPAEGTLEGETLRGHLDFMALHAGPAEARYRKALALEPRRPALWRNLGHALMLGHRTGQAVECWQTFVRLGGRDGRIEDFLQGLDGQAAPGPGSAGSPGNGKG